MTLIPNDYEKRFNEVFETLRKEIDALKAENKELKEQLHLHSVSNEILNFKNMELLADNTVEELKQIREEYVKKYIGDFDKPIDYARTLLHLDRLIMTKG